MTPLETAIRLAVEAHAGQTDRGGAPYILHPLKLMLEMTDEAARIAAVLHDVVEDTPVTLDDLRAHGFEELVVGAVEALTKRPGETRLEAAHRAAAHPVARRVKLADVRHNMDLSRLAQPTDRDHARLEQYRQVLAVLEAI